MASGQHGLRLVVILVIIDHLSYIRNFLRNSVVWTPSRVETRRKLQHLRIVENRVHQEGIRIRGYARLTSCV